MSSTPFTAPLDYSNVFRVTPLLGHDSSVCIKGSDGPGISFFQFDSYMSLTDAAALWIDFPVTHIDKKKPRGGSGSISCRRDMWDLMLPTACTEINLNNKWHMAQEGPEAVSLFKKLFTLSVFLITYQEEQVTCGMSPTKMLCGTNCPDPRRKAGDAKTELLLSQTFQAAVLSTAHFSKTGTIC